MGTAAAVIFGGDSAEHEVSLSGARAVLSYAAEAGWEVRPMGVARDGSWLVGGGALQQLWQRCDSSRLPRGNHLTDLLPGAGEPVETFDGPPPQSLFSDLSLAFPVCHGRWGEDGTLQGLLASFGVPIAGCGVAASAVCFDKHLTRSVLTAAGLQVAKGIRVEWSERDSATLKERVLSEIGPGPWFVKPVAGGSSLGVSQVQRLEDLDDALGVAWRWGNAALIEELVPHRELVVGVTGSGSDMTVSPPGECVPVNELYTYEEKYLLGNPGFVCPAPLDDVITARAQDLARRAYRALGCSVFARVDLFLDRRDGRLLVNEVNTIPGMTAVSVFPKVMMAAGLTYPQLLAEIGRLAQAY